jgi:outer membrane protein
MRRTLLSLALCIAATGAGAANLGDIYQLARKNDPVYAAAYAAYKAGLEKLPQGQSLLYPSINLSASARHSETDSSAWDDGWRGTDPYGFSLSLTQPLYRKQNLEAFEQTRLQALLSEQQLKLAQQDLLLRVAKAYFDVLEAEDNLATAGAQKEAIAQQLAQAKRSFEVGAATIVDTHEAQARYDTTVAQEIAAANTLEVSRRALEKLIQAEAPALAKLADRSHIGLPEPNDMAAWVKWAETESLAVAASQTAEEIARREVERQRGGLLPTLDLAASYSDNRNTSTSLAGTNIDTQSASIGLEFAWNLYQGGATDSRIREAQALQEKARFELDNARRQSVLDTRQAFLGVISGDARVKALEQAQLSSETQLKSTRLGQEVGVRTSVDVLNAQQQLFSARRDLAAARYDALISGLQLKAASGRLGEADLQPINALLQQ